MFAPDGSMLHFSSKSALMAIWEKLPPRSPDQRGSDRTTPNTIEGMAELQCLDISDWVKICAQVAENFVATIEQKYGRRYEVHRPDFDRYEVSVNVVRRSDKRIEARRSGCCLLQDHRFSRQGERRFVVAWGSECKVTHKDVQNLQGNQEEADTKIILHAADATSDGAMDVHSSDNDTFVLALRRYPELCAYVFFVTAKGRNRRAIKLQPIVQALG